MSYVLRQDYVIDKELLYYQDGNIVGISRTVLPAVGDNIAINDQERRLVPQGIWAVDMPDGTARFLPRAKVANTAVTTGSPTVEVGTDLASVFLPGDVIYAVGNYSVLTITSVAVGQTVVLDIGDYADVLIATSTTAVNADFAVEVADAINSNLPLSRILKAVATGDTVYLYSPDAVTTTSVAVDGTSTATASLSAANLLPNNTALGTIQSIDGVAGTLTLAANSAIAVPVGVPVGAKYKQLLGLVLHARDFTEMNQQNLAILSVSSGVKEGFIPYVDSEIKKALPKILVY